MAIRKAPEMNFLQTLHRSRFSGLQLRTLATDKSRDHVVPLAYNRYGEKYDRGTNPLVIGHGLFGQKLNWHSVSKALQKRLGNQIYTVDFRNHGDSPHTSSHTYKDMAEDLAEFVKKVVIPESGFETVHLLGHSMGGKVASTFAVKPRFQRLLASLIVEDVSPVHDSKNSHFRRYLAAMYAADLSKSRKEIGEDLTPAVPDKAVRDFLLTNLIADPSKDGSFRWKVNLDAIDTYLDQIFAPCLTSGQFDGKTLFLSGASSNYIQESDHSEIQKFFPNSKFYAVPKAGHWVHAEQPAAFMDALVKFLHST